MLLSLLHILELIQQAALVNFILLLNIFKINLKNIILNILNKK